ncbi:hypothetical protein [Saccharibacillus kuerlensis]|uniref:DUF5590 domain-containing protein n=1 Tax=Saccharibacillus kuerlensis TaxID=459527 RepID=A0ABQ2KSR0_9BACL|nr:hypothetical protein [Saccharibacillus kuerlensis]GGN91471.1 hypothetical protein GCM10010969_03190 [Saccharibacillus kuerlensis]
MKFLYLATVAFLIFLIVGCSQQQTFEGFFHKKMEQMHMGEKDYSYELVYKEFNVVHQDDAVAVFKENNKYGDQIFIAYFEKQDNQWSWKQSSGAEWNSPVKWSSMNQTPFIYSGTISGNSISEVYAGNEPAEIIEVEEDKKFWYAISPIEDVKVMVVKEDGTKEIIEEINYKELSSE